MRFTIKDNTSPLTADVLAKKDFSFGSGGGGGGGGGSAVIAPHQPIVYKSVGPVEPYGPLGHGLFKIYSLPVTLKGNRWVKGNGNIWARGVAGGANVVGVTRLVLRVAVTLDGAIPPDGIKGINEVMLRTIGPFDKDLNYTVSCAFNFSSTGLAGNHVIDLWASNESRVLLGDTMTEEDATFEELNFGLDVMEFDAI